MNHAAEENLLNKTKAGFDWPLAIFFILAYSIAWGVMGIMSLVAAQSGTDVITLMGMGEVMDFGGIEPALPGWLIYLLTRMADFAFSIAGVIMIAVVAGKAGLAQLGRRLIKWRVPWRYYLLALVPLLFYAVAAAVTLSGDPGAPQFNLPVLGTILFSLEAGLFVSLFLRGAMGEELGLRGFALPRLQSYTSPFKASVLIGILWALWHLPVLFNRDIVSIVAFLLVAFGLSFIFTWLFNGSGGSLIPVLLFHATQNWEEGFEVVFPALVGSDWELVSTLSLLVLSIIAAVVVWRQGRSQAVK